MFTSWFGSWLVAQRKPVTFLMMVNVGCQSVCERGCFQKSLTEQRRLTLMVDSTILGCSSKLNKNNTGWAPAIISLSAPDWGCSVTSCLRTLSIWLIGWTLPSAVTRDKHFFPRAIFCQTFCHGAENKVTGIPACFLPSSPAGYLHSFWFEFIKPGFMWMKDLNNTTATES